ncbi:MAG: hypothetical protein OHK0022_54010 [Roseiflexaceae bacterium]
MWQHYVIPRSLDEALRLLAEQPGQARPVAGGTDLVIEIDRGLRAPTTLVDLTRLPGLDRIWLGDDGRIHIGALVTHNQVVASPLCVERALPLAQACLEVGAPQIRNRATLAGNLVTASPANDTITPLIALNARVTLASVRGQRTLPLAEFYTGVRRTVLAPDELLTGISLLPLADNERGIYLKLGLRRAQAISVVNVAAVVELAAGRVAEASIALGCVAPTIVRAGAAERALAGRPLDSEAIMAAAELAEQAARPIDDLRGSAAYRRGMVRSLVARALHALADGSERANWPARPIFLSAGAAATLTGGAAAPDAPVETIETTINGVPTTLAGAHDQTLLDALRDVAGLTGTKKGCAEGECGSCTVWLNGAAVMGCLTPAAQAHGAEVLTVEGLARDGRLHPVQQAFIEQGAVQCGYCTPGLLMSAARLLEEQPRPTAEDARQAIAGNLCRCTGYAKVIAAISAAAQQAEP